MQEAQSSAAQAFQREDKLSGLPTGFERLDKRLGGLTKSNLIIIAGRPAMGKTGFVLSLMAGMSRASVPVLLLSATAFQLTYIMSISLCAELNVPEPRLCPGVKPSETGI